MILYHGSNIEVKQPVLLKGQCPLDFGPGFYTTSDLEQASKWAQRTARIKKSGKLLVSIYEISNESLSRLSVLSFNEANLEWLRFVASNRRNLIDARDYDIACGPVTNDQTMPTLMLFLDGFLSEEEAIARLLPQKLKDQYVFKSEKALAALSCIEVRAL